MGAAQQAVLRNTVPHICCWLCRVVVLEDNDVLHIVGGGYGIYNTAQADVEAAVPRKLLLLDMEVDSIMKVCKAWRVAWYKSAPYSECRYCMNKLAHTSMQAGSLYVGFAARHGIRAGYVVGLQAVLVMTLLCLLTFATRACVVCAGSQYTTLTVGISLRYCVCCMRHWPFAGWVRPLHAEGDP